jgi:hypothetical protein
MKGISKMSSACKEMSESWRKVWPDCIADQQEHGTTLESITEEVTERAK